MAKATLHPAGLPVPRGSYSLVNIAQPGRMMFIAGQTASDHEGKVAGVGDPRAQMRAVLTKIRLAIEAAGGRYVDAAIMAPVQPSALSVPVLLSGLHAGGAASALAEAGFLKLGIVGAEVGRAATIKMLRSVMIKGIEALTAEMMLAARLAGVDGDVLASLGEDWARRADYNLERMRAHGARRAAEMEEVASTLEALGVEPLMTRATVARQREMAE